MIAYHGQQEIKDKFISRVRKHREADQIIQGTYWEGGRGCAVGCTMHSATNPHKKYEKQIGVPERIAYLEDAIFEGLPIEAAKQWPEKFLQAIPVGADLSLIHHQFCAWLLTESGLLTVTDSNREAIATVAALHSRAANGEAVSASEWSEAARSAWSEAARSAWSALSAAAESAAWSTLSAARSARSAWSALSAAAESAAWSTLSAARSAAWSARSAARSAAESEAARSARSAAWSEAARSARSAWSALSAAAESAAWSTLSAARSAAWSARSAAESARSAYETMAAKLLKLLADAPVPSAV